MPQHIHLLTYLSTYLPTYLHRYIRTYMHRPVARGGGVPEDSDEPPPPTEHLEFHLACVANSVHVYLH